ncbi:MAG: hypothetical protein HRU28_18075 [Rhizobiales bacterium]|nr:hypothetical protein [Hyphomicrobiales bacterium]
MKMNKIIRISLSGGLIGILTTNPRRALDAAIDKQNQDGWNAIFFERHKPANIIVFIGTFYHIW